jgi:putative heme-binding domain-containing protein
VAPSYETLNIFLMNGRLVSGVKIKEDKGVVTIGDNQGKVHEILRDEIEEMQVQPRSTMPDGLEKRLTDQEFLDLLAFLLSQKKK